MITIGRGKDKRTSEKVEEYKNQLEMFKNENKLAFVTMKGVKTNLIISSRGILYALNDGKIEIVKPYLEKSGHLRYSKKINGKDVKKYIHQMVAEAFIPNPKNKPEVHHKDGNELNNDYRNLMWVTHKEHVILTKYLNQYKGKAGSSNGNSRDYKDSQIEHACKLIEENKLCPTEICKITGISYPEFQHILHRPGYWGYITNKYDFSKYNKFKRQVYTKEQKQEFIHLRNTFPEYTLRKISKIMNVRYEAVKNWNVAYKDYINK